MSNLEINIETLKDAVVSAVAEAFAANQSQFIALMTTPEVAERWGVSINKVLFTVGTGELRAIRISARLYRYRLEDVDACEALWASTDLLDKP